jgi:hypothetical protein
MMGFVVAHANSIARFYLESTTYRPIIGLRPTGKMEDADGL